MGRGLESDGSRARRAAVVLLLLTLHAVQAGATHFPRAGRPPALQTGQALSSVADREASAPAESGAHAQCLLCRLQRSLSACLKNSAPVALSPPQVSPASESASDAALRPAPQGVAHGRAPPRS